MVYGLKRVEPEPAEHRDLLGGFATGGAERLAALCDVDAGLAIGRLILTRLPAHERLGVAARAVMTLGIALAAFAGPITAGRPWERLGAVVSIWAVLNGLLDMAIGAGVFGGARRRWHVVMGAVSVVLGASLLAWPPGMIALTLWIVLFSALYGAVTIVEASRGVRVE